METCRLKVFYTLKKLQIPSRPTCRYPISFELTWFFVRHVTCYKTELVFIHTQTPEDCHA